MNTFRLHWYRNDLAPQTAPPSSQGVHRRGRRGGAGLAEVFLPVPDNIRPFDFFLVAASRRSGRLLGGPAVHPELPAPLPAGDRPGGEHTARSFGAAWVQAVELHGVRLVRPGRHPRPDPPTALVRAVQLPASLTTVVGARVGTAALIDHRSGVRLKLLFWFG